MSEADYTVVAYDTPVAFATTLARLNPNLVFTYVTGAHTDGTEKGRVMWARVKGRAENALMRLPFKGVIQLSARPDDAEAGTETREGTLPGALVLAPVMKLFFPALTLEQVGRAMIRA